MEHQYKVRLDISNSDITNDLEWPLRSLVANVTNCKQYLEKYCIQNGITDEQEITCIAGYHYNCCMQNKRYM